MASRTHGEAPSKTSNHVFRGTPEYRAWVGMVARCYSPNNTRFHRYGGRGITVCERCASGEIAYREIGFLYSAAWKAQNLTRPASRLAADQLEAGQASEAPRA